MNLRIYLFVSGVNEKGMYVQAFLLSPQMFESFHLVLPQARWCNLVCVEEFCFIGF